MADSVGFIGGGRIARVILEGWRRSGTWPGRVVVSDCEARAVMVVRSAFPSVEAVLGDNGRAAAERVVFLAVHPPAMKAVLGELRGRIASGSLVVSLAPKLTIAEIATALGGSARVARVIPNAPSIVGAGFNPVAFAPGLPESDRQALGALMAPLGAVPEVPERDLEAYAILTAMGPTYLWFQWYELLALAEDFGLERAPATHALAEMFRGTLRTALDSGLSPEEVMDLVPVRPLAQDEEAIKGAYRLRLRSIWERIRAASAA
jgi:pyrroline-5-carboxylate reductase